MFRRRDSLTFRNSYFTVRARRPHIRAQRLARSGYTLIEMLIASLLVAALMSVVWGMMSMYNSFLTTGQADATERQLVRSIMQLLADDLQAVPLGDSIRPRMTAIDISGLAPSEFHLEESLEADNALIPLADLSDSSELVSDSDRFSAPAGIRLKGDSMSVHLSVERAPLQPPIVSAALSTGQELSSPDSQAAMDFAETEMSNITDDTSGEQIAPRVPEFQSCIWQFHSPEGTSSGSQRMRSGLYRIELPTGTLQNVLRQQGAESNADSAGAEISLDRSVLEAVLFSPVEVESDARSTAGSAEPSERDRPRVDRIPEVVGCSFEYFAGTEWRTSWDSELQHELPQAVRVRLRMMAATDLENLQRLIGEPGSTDDVLDRALDAESISDSQIAGSDLSEGAASSESAFKIPTRQVQRIILLQSVAMALPQPGNSDPAASNPADLLEQESVP
jgi:prepilin-type N-terminal cleavage/methylation domain-containing protein